MMNPYLPVLIILILGLLLGALLSAFSYFLGPKKEAPSKLEPFECGVPQVGHRERMSVKFYMTAILFILFDIETVFLYLWAKSFYIIGWLGIFEILIFVLVLIVGYIYVRKQGALEWD